MATITANLIGIRCSWSVNDWLGSRDEAVELAKTFGISDELFPSQTLKKAVGRATKSVVKADNGRFTDNLPPRKVADNKDKAVYALVSERRDEGLETVAYEQATTVRLDKENGRVDATGTQAAEFMTEFDKYKDCLTDEDIRRLCRNVINNSCGIPYNPNGHDYFVPEAHQEVVERLDKFLRALGVGRMWITPAIDDSRSLEATWERAAEYLLAEVAKVGANVAVFEKRVKCLHDKNDRLKVLKDMAAMYGQMTQRAAEAEEVLNAVNTVANAVAAKIDEIEASR